jgi:hypothetical protein
MRSVMSTALGVGIGHAVSHTLIGAMSGSEKQAAVAEAKSDVPESCKFQLQTFDKCLEKSEDPSQCQWIYEDLQSCKKSSKF